MQAGDGQVERVNSEVGVDDKTGIIMEHSVETILSIDTSGHHLYVTDASTIS